MIFPRAWRSAFEKLRHSRLAGSCYITTFSRISSCFMTSTIRSETSVAEAGKVRVTAPAVCSVMPECW